MRVGGEHEFVGLRPLPQLVQPLPHHVRGAVHGVLEPAAEDLPLVRGEHMGPGLLGVGTSPGRPLRNRTVVSAPVSAWSRASSFALRGEREHAHDGVRLGQHGGGTERLPVQLQRGDRVVAREVVREGEGQSQPAGQLRAEPRTSRGATPRAARPRACTGPGTACTRRYGCPSGSRRRGSRGVRRHRPGTCRPSPARGSAAAPGRSTGRCPGRVPARDPPGRGPSPPGCGTAPATTSGACSAA